MAVFYGQRIHVVHMKSILEFASALLLVGGTVAITVCMIQIYSLSTRMTIATAAITRLESELVHQSESLMSMAEHVNKLSPRYRAP